MEQITEKKSVGVKYVGTKRSSTKCECKGGKPTPAETNLDGLHTIFCQECMHVLSWDKNDTLTGRKVKKEQLSLPTVEMFEIGIVMAAKRNDQVSLVLHGKTGSFTVQVDTTPDKAEKILAGKPNLVGRLAMVQINGRDKNGRELNPVYVSLVPSTK